MESVIETSINLIVGKGLADHHRRWYINKETAHARAQSPTKTIPTTLHAAIYNPSWRNAADDAESSGSSALVSKTSSAPSNGADSTAFLPDPSFVKVHGHFARLPPHQSYGTCQLPEIMQSYDFKQKNAGHRVGYNLNQRRKGFRKTPRKMSDLEKLPPLSSALATEMERRQEVTTQATRYAELREARKAEIESHRRRSTAERHPMPPFILRTDRFRRENKNLVDDLPPHVTPPASPPQVQETARAQPQAIQDVVGNPTNELHVRFAPNLIQQRQKPQLAPPMNQRRPSRPMTSRRRSSNGGSKLNKVTTVARG